MFGEVYCVFLLSGMVLGGIVPQDNPKDGPLNLSPFLYNGEIEKARYLSKVDPSLFAGVKSHAAYFTVNETGKWNTFFWYFPVEEAPVESTPLIIWLQGGPGASSMYRLFKEIGPIKINGTTGEVERMPITWGSNYSLLFIDNPVGAGFSYSDGGEYTTDEDMVGSSLLNFLEQFLQVFTETIEAPLFIAGESYAGKYIPAFGHYIHNRKTNYPPINLKGLAIGNGWTDPPTLLHYSELALQLGLVDHQQANSIHISEVLARRYLKKGNFTAYERESKKAFFKLVTYAPVNFYNFLKDFQKPDSQDFEIFLNRKDVQRAIHVKQMKYAGFSRLVAKKMSHDVYDTVKPWLEEMLEHYGVMCYSGQLDLMVGYALSVNTYRSLNWSGAKDYRNASRKPLWNAHTKIFIGFVKESGNFIDVMVRGAGHMVPADKPREAKEIIDMFINKFK